MRSVVCIGIGIGMYWSALMSLFLAPDSWLVLVAGSWLVSPHVFISGCQLLRCGLWYVLTIEPWTAVNWYWYWYVLVCIGIYWYILVNPHVFVSSCYWLLWCGLWYVLSLGPLSMLCGRLLLVTLVTHCALTVWHWTSLNFTCRRCFAILLLTWCNLYCLCFTYIVILLHFITFYWISLQPANHWLWHMQPQERQMFSSGFSNSLSIIFNLIFWLEVKEDVFVVRKILLSRNSVKVLRC